MNDMQKATNTVPGLPGGSEKTYKAKIAAGVAAAATVDKKIAKASLISPNT